MILSSQHDMHKLAATKRVASQLMRDTPERAFSLMDRPSHDILRFSFYRYIENVIESDEDIDQASGLLSQDMAVVADILLHTIERSGEEVVHEQALTIAAHSDTVRSISRLALYDAGTAGELVADARTYSTSIFTLGPQLDSIIIKPYMHLPEPTRRRCPAAEPLRDGLPPPLFRNFVKWCGAVAIHSGRLSEHQS